MVLSIYFTTCRSISRADVSAPSARLSKEDHDAGDFPKLRGESLFSSRLPPALVVPGTRSSPSRSWSCPSCRGLPRRGESTSSTSTCRISPATLASLEAIANSVSPPSPQPSSGRAGPLSSARARRRSFSCVIGPSGLHGTVPCSPEGSTGGTTRTSTAPSTTSISSPALSTTTISSRISTSFEQSVLDAEDDRPRLRQFLVSGPPPPPLDSFLPTVPLRREESSSPLLPSDKAVVKFAADVEFFSVRSTTYGGTSRGPPRRSGVRSRPLLSLVRSSQPPIVSVDAV